jgi:hypothetical protein
MKARAAKPVLDAEADPMQHRVTVGLFASALRTLQ